MSEGSVVSDSAVVEEDSVEEVNTPETDESEPQEETQETVQEETPEPPRLTEDGTRLDPNPQSAVHQELANARRRLDAYKTVLDNPALYNEFVAQSGRKQPEFEEITPDKLQTLDDVARYLTESKREVAERTSAYEREIKGLREEVNQMTTKQYQQAIHSELANGIQLVQEKYPELRDDGEPELVQEVIAMYEELNIDPQTGMDTGRVPLTKVADRLMRVRNSVKKSASDEAQTVVRQKSMGKVVTSQQPTGGQTNWDDLSIAERIAKTYKRR